MEKLAEQTAWPLPLRATFEQSVTAAVLSTKVTVPSVTGLPPLKTVAVKLVVLVGAVVKVGFTEEVASVVVPVAEAVVIVMHQPAMLPISPDVSSTT